VIRFRDEVTRIRAGVLPSPDGGDSGEDWSEGAVSEQDYPADFQPLSTTEDVVLQQRTESTHRVFLPAGADVLVTDRIRYGGVDYKVDGEPERWKLRGVDHHVEVFVFRVQGG
jgi:hypothetical protein